MFDGEIQQNGYQIDNAYGAKVLEDEENISK